MCAVTAYSVALARLEGT
jgi:hypothetical protein